MIRAGIIKTSSVVGVAQNTQISLKRKVSDEQQYLSLEDNLKRFRITYTPGELRCVEPIVMHAL